jgi:hypothetical protein
MTARRLLLSCFPAALATLLVAGLPMLAVAEIYTEQQGEITFETSWYPRDAAVAGQDEGFTHIEARPELYVETDNAALLLQPRLTGGSAGHGLADLREAHVTTRVGDLDILLGTTDHFLGQDRKL